MFQFLPARWLAALPVAAALSVSAQPAPAPADATLPAPYVSAMDGYQAFSDEKLAPWRESNDNVGRIGGWKAYAREAQQQEAGAATPATPASPTPATAPVPQPRPARSGHMH